MLPKTYLMTAPVGGDINPFGEAMRHLDLVKGLRQCNPKIRCPTHEIDVTTLWLGEPHAQGSRFLLALPHGLIPEFTQLEGKLMFQRGWRAVIDKLVNSHVILKATANRIFKINLDYDGWDGYCIACRKDSIFMKATAASKLCDDCEFVRKESSKEADKERARWRPTGKVMVDHGSHSIT